VRDRHPGYRATRLAEELDIERVKDVQHHHAHVAAVAGEYGVTQRVLGIAYDGTGYGDDGNVWGAEFLVADLTNYERVGQLRYAPLPGGDLAIRRSWRTALGYLSLEPAAARAFALAFEGVSEAERSLAARQIQAGLNAPSASSMGRLFDAAAAVLGVRRINAYEAQAAMELEALAGARPASPLPLPVVTAGLRGWVLDPLPLLVALGERRAARHDVADLAAQFHESVAVATAELARLACVAHGVDVVALGGGVFQNARLLESVVRRLEAHSLRVLVPRHLSPNDGAISYGQAVVASAQLAQERNTDTPGR
jgi:hydrogenase maturation protein HypF